MKQKLAHFFSQKRNRYIFIGACLFLSAAFISFIAFSTRSGELLTPEVAGAQEPAPPATPLPTPPDDLSYLNILLLGYGGAGHQGGYLTDVVQVAHFDFEKKLLSLISIPRDIWVQYPDGVSRKVNAGFSLDGGETDVPTTNLQPEEVSDYADLSKGAATAVTGLPIHYAIAVDFVGFQRLVGEGLGGITVDVPTTLSDPWYPIRGQEVNPCGYTPEEITELTAKYSGFQLEKQFPCRYEHIQYQAGKQDMQGSDALKYVRSRHSTSDFDRGIRQQVVLLGIQDKLLSLETINDIPQIFSLLIEHVHTDINLEIAKYLGPALQTIGDFQVKQINLSTENVLTTSKSNTGAFILTPKSSWANVHDYIQSELNN